jgi:hypothetical protein
MANDDPAPKKTGLCVHLNINGTINKTTGENRIEGVRLTGAHLAPEPPACAHGAGAGGVRMCNAVTDSYRDGWDRIFGGQQRDAGGN